MSWVKVRWQWFICAYIRLTCVRAQINTFHWHVVDSQSFPLIVPDFTELSENGAYSPSQVYSPRDVRDIIDYAAAVTLS